MAGKNPFAGGAAYNASKFALNGFTEAMMLDHRRENVRVSYVCRTVEDISGIVLTILRMPERTLISRVEVRPSKPNK